MAQPTAQPIPDGISLREARELVAQRYLSPPLAERLVVEWLNDENEPVRWWPERIENNSRVSTETALEGFWRLSTINWEESSAGRKVEPPPVAAPGGVTPGGVVWASYPRPTQPVSQLGPNFVIYGIRLMREDVERRLRRPEEPAIPAPPSSPSAADPLIKPKQWFEWALKQYPRRRGEQITDWMKRLSKLMETASVTRVWPWETLRRRYYEKIAEDAKEKEERKAAQKKH